MTTTLTRTPDAAPRSHESRLTRWCVDHRWLVLLVSFLFLAGGVAAMGTLGINTTPPEKQLVGDSRIAEDLKLGKDFGERPTEMVVATAPAPISPERATRLGATLATAYAGVHGVAEVGPPFPGQDGRSVVVPVVLVGDEESAADQVEPVLAVTESLAAAHPDLEIGQVGPGTFDKAMSESFSDDFQRAEMISIPVTLTILLIAFGAVVAAGVPLVLGLGAVGVGMGATALASQGIVAVDPNAQSLVLLIGLAVGVDYALFIVRRAREERRKGLPVRDAIVAAGGSAGRAVVISGLTVAVAMSGMLVAGGLFTSLAIGTMFVVLAAIVASATTLPALLAVLGDKVDAIRLPFTRRRMARDGDPDGMWGRLAGAVVRRPVALGGAVALLLLAAALPALTMRTALGGVETLDQSLPVVAAYHQLEEAVPTDGTSIQVVVGHPASASDEVGAALLAAGQDATSVAHVTGAAPRVASSSDGSVTTLDLAVDVTASDDRIHDVIDDLRATVVPDVESALADVPDASVHLSGEAAGVELAEWMDSRLPWVVGFVLLLTLVVMAVSFGSPWLAATTVALNVLSVSAAYGVMTLVFSDGTVGRVMDGLLGFTSTGAIASWLPLLMFVILFGLSMDYHVFVTSRVREAYDDGAAPREAVRLGVARSAGVVTSAAAVMIGVFSIFGTLTMLDMKQLGVGLGVAVLLDATLVRGVLLPAALAVLGHRAHRGPAWLPRLHH